ncbi:MAG: DUF3320 domain-containing protein [Phycisphaerales bacterium]|nr:DUF3320 domain-containing protein [Phycisphaerales bacterium]
MIHPQAGLPPLSARQAREAKQHRLAQTPRARSKSCFRLTDLFRAARAALDDSGACTLYVALGSLMWTETPGATERRRAPLLLLPVSLERPSAREPFVLRRFTDEPRVNVTLLEKLRLDFKLDVSGLETLPEDDLGINVGEMLTRFRRLVRDIEGWEIVETCDLGLFSFSKFLMWLDLHARANDLIRSPMVAGLVLGTGLETGTTPPSDPACLDSAFAPGDLPCLLDADSSQLAAVAAGMAGRSFVLQGPPGTGKSQTIANLIGCALAEGKRVLFVAEKRAALDVVRSRLDRCGLGPFCLEVHSHVSGKRDVLDQIQEAIEAGRTSEPEAWAGAGAELEEVRDELNELADAVHASRRPGLSWYEATCRVLSRGKAADVPLAIPELDNLDLARGEALRHAAHELSRAARPVWPIRTHPLREVIAVSPNARDVAAVAIDAARAGADALVDALDGFLAGARAAVAPPGTPPPALSDARTLSSADRSAALALAGLGPAPAGFATSAADPSRWPGVEAALRGWVRDANALRAARAELEQAWSPAMLDADLEAIERALARADARSFIGFRWWCARSPRKALRPLVRGTLPKSIPDLLRAVRAAGALRAERARLGTLDEAAKIFGPSWNKGEPTAGALEACVSWGAQASSVCRALGESRDLAPLAGAPVAPGWPGSVATGSADRFIAAERDFEHAHQALANALAHDLISLGADSGGSLASLLGVFARWRAGLDELDDWSHWRACVLDAGEPLAGLAGALASGGASPDDIPDAFEKALWRAWADVIARADSRLNAFSASAAWGLVERFRAADTRLIELARHVVRARLSARLPEGAGPASEHSEMGILQRQLKLQRRHLPVRRLIERLPNLLPRLKPCFLMSPLSVAQYLDAAHPSFDLVIFDEASQIPVWDAVGAIARGRQVVVVGDSRQLPPTTFFRRLEGDEAPEEDIEELESVLDEAVAAGTPEVRLLWHYRSRHESLISFSNQRYYAGRLQTFPSARAVSPSLGVHLRRVAGVYDRSGTRTNRIEAEALVAEVLGALQAAAAARTPVSLGVVTFSQAQQTLIEDLFDRARSEHPEIEPYFTQEIDPVFVKNLENVQGDERDAMYFSIGYGPDAAGHLTLGFGPLNRVGGERRLNVAVTRARSRLVVFASMDADAIDLSRTSSVGAGHLRAFLEHAERASTGTSRPPEQLPAELLAPARGLQDALRAHGYESDLAVGASPYRVDLGVRHPERPGEYALGVEFDGPFYARASTCRDRERSRQGVLANLGWTIERVYTHEWARQPERVAERILGRLVRGAGASPAGAPASSARAAPPEARPAGARAATPYSAIATGKARGSPEQFHDPVADRTLGRAILEIVKHEGPIVPALLARRVARLWRLSRVTSRVHARIAELLASQPGMPEERDGALWPLGGDPESYSAFRPHGPEEDDWREIEEIPPAELRAVVAAVLRTNVALPVEELARQAALWMGFARGTSRTDEAFVAAARQLAKRGGCIIEDGQARLI